MPEKSEFRVLPDRLGAAGELIASCKSKAEGLAGQLAEIRRGLKGSASSIGELERSVAALEENILDQAKRMDRAAEAVLFSAARYGSAERAILGQPLKAAADGPAAGARPSGGSGTAENRTGSSSSEKKGEAKQKAGGKGAAAAGAGAAAAGGKWIDGYRESKSGWEGTTFKKSDASYLSAYVETTVGPDGKEKKTVSSYIGKSSVSESVGILDASVRTGGYKVKENPNLIDKGAGKLFDLEKKIRKKLSINRWEKTDPADPTKDRKNDWSNRVWESRKVPKDPARPNGPSKTQMERLLTEQDKLKNSFSKDITGAKLVQWKKEVSGTLLNLSTSKEGKYTSGSASVSLITGTAGASAGLGVYYAVKNGRKVLAYGADAQVGASASLVKAEASGKAGYAPDALKKVLGKDFDLFGVEGAAEGKVGHVEANAGAKARIVDGNLELAAEGDAGAYAVKGSVGGRGNLLGVKVGGSLEGNVGIGVSGKIGLTGGKLRCEFGASLGLGFKVKFDIDIQGAANAVKNGVIAAGKAVVNAAKSVGNTIVNVGKAIGGFFSKW